jgi:hypothetical protein
MVEEYAFQIKILRPASMMADKISSHIGSCTTGSGWAQEKEPLDEAEITSIAQISMEQPCRNGQPVTRAWRIARPR